MDANDQHLFVVGTVEDADSASLGRRQIGAPQEIVLEFGGAGLFEACDVAALRVDAAHDVANGAIFTGGVHALEDQQERVAVGAVEKLLLIAERGDVFLEKCAIFLFGLVEGLDFCRELAEFDVGVWKYAKFFGVDLHGFLEVLSCRMVQRSGPSGMSNLWVTGD